MRYLTLTCALLFSSTLSVFATDTKQRRVSQQEELFVELATIKDAVKKIETSLQMLLDKDSSSVNGVSSDGSSDRSSSIGSDGSESVVIVDPVDHLFKSVYGKAIESIELKNFVNAEDLTKLSKIAPAALNLQIILNPQQFIYDQLVAKLLNSSGSYDVNQLKQKILNAIQDNKELIEQYRALLKTDEVKIYLARLKDIASKLKGSAEDVIWTFIHQRTLDNGYMLRVTGGTLVNTFSAQLFANGIVRQNGVDESGKIIGFEEAEPIISSSVRDDALIYMKEVLASIVAYQFSLSTSGYVFEKAVFEKAGILIPGTVKGPYILKGNKVFEAEIVDGAYVVKKGSKSIHALTSEEYQLFGSLVTALSKTSLGKSKLTSPKLAGFKLMLNLKSPFELSETE